MGKAMQTSRSVVLALAAWTTPSLAVAAPAPRSSVRVEIDVSALEAFDAGGIDKDLRVRTERIVDKEGFFLDDGAGDSIVVRIDYVDKEDLEYGIHIFVKDDGKVVEPGEEWFVCMYCSHKSVGERYAERLPGALARLRAANEGKAAPAQTDDAATGGEQPAEESKGGEPKPEADATEQGSQPRAERPFVLRNAGLATVIPGGVALGVGIGLVLAGTQRVDRGDDITIYEQHYRSPGIALVVVGGVGAAAGIGLLVAHALRARGHGSARERLTWTPVFGEHTGVMLRGRF